MVSIGKYKKLIYIYRRRSFWRRINSVNQYFTSWRWSLWRRSNLDLITCPTRRWSIWWWIDRSIIASNITIRRRFIWLAIETSHYWWIIRRWYYLNIT
jgi:hypothetical protein